MDYSAEARVDSIADAAVVVAGSEVLRRVRGDVHGPALQLIASPRWTLSAS